MSELFKEFDFSKRKNSDISSWYVYNVTNMDSMFRESNFNGELNWIIKLNCNKNYMFSKCPDVFKETELDACPSSIQGKIKRSPLIQFTNGKKEKIWSFKDEIKIFVSYCEPNEKECFNNKYRFNLYYKGDNMKGRYDRLKMPYKDDDIYDDDAK